MKQIKDSIKKIFGIPKTMVKEIDKTIDEKIEKNVILNHTWTFQD